MKLSTRLVLTGSACLICSSIILLVVAWLGMSEISKRSKTAVRAMISQDHADIADGVSATLSVLEPVFRSQSQVKPETDAALRQAILGRKVGKSGYVYILKGTGERRGAFVIYKDPAREGKVVLDVTDVQGYRFFESMVNKAVQLEPGQTAMERYLWKDNPTAVPRWKIAVVSYFKPWDWVIATSAYEDDIEAEIAPITEHARTLFQYLLLVSAVSLALAIGVFYLFASRVSKRIVQLAGVADAIGRGDVVEAAQRMSM